MAGSSSAKIPTALKKLNPKRYVPFNDDHRSDRLHTSSIPSNVDARSYYLTRGQLQRLPPPIIAVSEFVPRRMVGLLMTRKKDAAIGVKWVGRGGYRTFGKNRPDEITNMEGALHTFVTPVVGRCEMIGDYRYSSAMGGHGVPPFGDEKIEGSNKKVRITRSVVMSASIQMDFEGTMVLLRVCRLDSHECLGLNLFDDKNWRMISVEDKQDDHKREAYDDLLRRHMVYYLTRDGRLPARRDVPENHRMDVQTTIAFLEQIVSAGNVTEKIAGRFAELHNDQLVSVELLVNTALHQLRNEISALEALCPSGYVYTYDPASIFAREIGASVLNRLMLAGLRILADSNAFRNMRVFAFNDYADPGILKFVSRALTHQPGVQVLRKEDLFKGPEGRYDVRQYKNASGAMLVVYNNSDAFGQNIESEGDFGSLDGAIGCNSSAAASLARDREDLLDFVF